MHVKGECQEGEIARGQWPGRMVNALGREVCILASELSSLCLNPGPALNYHPVFIPRMDVKQASHLPTLVGGR